MRKQYQLASIICIFLMAGNLLPVFGTGLKKLPSDSVIRAGLTMPEGFVSTIVAKGISGARHLAVTQQGGIYVKLSRLKDGKGILYLKGKNADGTATVLKSFGDYPGTGIYIKNDYLYASSNDAVFRYRLNENGEVINPEKPERIVSGLLNHNRDNSKSVVVDEQDNLYVNVGSYSNSCLIDPASRKAPMPCPILDSAAGIWKFKANKLNQAFKDGQRYGTGFKNVVGLDWNSNTHSLFIMQHGRDQFHELYPEFYSEEDDHNQPAETMYELHPGSNGGWPYVYYDLLQRKKILAPEYGGNGKTEGDQHVQNPVMAFPAHMAPNGLLFYKGTQFPVTYRNGAFIAFHGFNQPSKKGYLLAFVPFNKNKPGSNWKFFAENFTNGNDMHRPCGLAQGPDGSIYVADDINGTIYKISYKK
jgi:glucose/arabinose dehydrogenase